MALHAALQAPRVALGGGHVGGLACLGRDLTDGDLGESLHFFLGLASQRAATLLAKLEAHERGGRTFVKLTHNPALLQLVETVVHFLVDGWQDSTIVF